MKKVLLFITLLISAVQGTYAQSGNAVYFNNETLTFILNAISILLVIYMVSSFILGLIRLLLNARLKKNLIDRGATEKTIELLLPKNVAEKATALKWVCLFTATGVGLTLISLFPPYGIHSAIILCFCLAVGLFIYYLLMRDKKG